MRRQTLLRRLLIATGAVVVLLIVGFGPSVITHFTKQPKQPALATVEQESFPVLATAAGQLVPANLENVNFTIAGQVQTIAVQVGAKVNAGQSLATLNDSSQQSVLNQANAAVIAADAAITQAQATGSRAQVAQALYQLAQAQVSRIRAVNDEAATVLRAPETGTVLAVNGVTGDIVSAGNSGPTNPASNGGSPATNGFIVIGNSSNFVVWAPFSQTAAITLVAGQSATVAVDALPGVSFPAKVTVVASSATSVGGVPEYYAEVTLSSSDTRLRNGQTGTVNVTIAYANNVLAVPSTALFSTVTNAVQVDVWSAGQAYATTVTTGLVGNRFTQITSGLIAGERILVSPAGSSVLPSSPAPSPT
jgi:macrolide-specific efflux system membrane fusion protein